MTERGPHRVALFFTGRRHAGENLQEALRRRAEAVAAAPAAWLPWNYRDNLAADAHVS